LRLASGFHAAEVARTVGYAKVPVL